MTGVVVERAAEFLDAGRQRVIADRAATPDAVEQLLFGDELLRALYQRAEHRSGPRRQLDDPAVAADLAAARLESNLPESKLAIRAHLGSRRLPGNFPELAQDLAARPRRKLSHAADGRQSVSLKGRC